MIDEDVRTLNTARKINPPLREAPDRDALIEGLRSGVIDCIATDHAPRARDEKEVPFEQAPMGTTGLETAFAAVYTIWSCRGRCRWRWASRSSRRGWGASSRSISDDMRSQPSP